MVEYEKQILELTDKNNVLKLKQPTQPTKMAKTTGALSTPGDNSEDVEKLRKQVQAKDEQIVKLK
jgi:hypothetical protein